jgi:hypothetical protein
MIENVIEEYNILSKKFMEFAKDENIPARINPNDEIVHDTFRNYKYPVTSWPILIDKEMSEQLNELSLTIPRLLRQIALLYFNNDIKKIADFYFTGDVMQAEFAMMCHKKNLEIGCRLDLTYTQNGFKVLEANMGSSLGGWQIQSLESLIRNSHSELMDPEKSGNYKGTDTVSIYVKFLVKQIIKSGCIDNGTLNLFIDMKDIEEGTQQQQNLDFFNGFFKRELAENGLRGEALTGNINLLELVDGKLRLQDKVINGVIFITLDVNPTPAIFRAFMIDRLYFPDHLGVSLLGDKGNLGILLELAQAGKFSARENELMIKHIPWTSSVENKKVIFKHKDYNLIELLKANKNSFVIKAARGFQGKDVFVGKFLSDDEWIKALETALESRLFIAQEFSDSVDFLAPNEQNEWTPHKLIWGAFGFGDAYGGVWVRMSEVKSNAAVINSATGAVEAIVFELLD